jgi:hypothetical protein
MGLRRGILGICHRISRGKEREIERRCRGIRGALLGQFRSLEE